jgi:hypothetical protein
VCLESSLLHLQNRSSPPTKWRSWCPGQKIKSKGLTRSFNAYDGDLFVDIQRDPHELFDQKLERVLFQFYPLCKENICQFIPLCKGILRKRVPVGVLL